MARRSYENVWRIAQDFGYFTIEALGAERLLPSGVCDV